MRLNFLRRKKVADAPAAAAAPSGMRALRTGVAFDGITEEWRLIGRMDVEGRLSDALNKREAITIHDVRWGPMDDSAPMVEAPARSAMVRATRSTR